MKRKFLSILLTLAMALTLLPTAAMAEGASYDCEGGTDCHHKVAKINDDPRYDDVVAHFDTLEEAIRLGQMETPPTFKLLDDLTEDEIIIYKLLSKTMLKPISEVAPYVPFGKSKTTKLLKEMCQKGVITVEGKGKSTKYIIS